MWARRALAYDLVDDPMFREQFGIGVPKGFDSHKLSEEMKLLANKMHEKMYQRIGQGTVTMALDGWTNLRHRYKVL